MKPVVILLDNGPIHTSKATTAAIASRAHRLTIEWLPKYTPELNDIEVVWGDLDARRRPIRPSSAWKPSALQCRPPSRRSTKAGNTIRWAVGESLLSL